MLELVKEIVLNFKIAIGLYYKILFIHINLYNKKYYHYLCNIYVIYIYFNSKIINKDSFYFKYLIDEK